MASDIRKAHEDGNLYCVFQPIVDLAARTTFGYEALVRCEDTDAFPHAGTIIDAALESKYMGELGRALRSMAIDGCPDHPLFLNVHPDEFDEGWLVRPDDSINGHEYDVFLEVTESVPLSHYEHCHSVLGEVRRRGAKIAVDDLGAGYSNLKYIADLEPDIVKLDRGMIAGIKLGNRRHRLLASIVELCRNQGARVVVEGIETEEELAATLEAEADFGQGYYFARPARGLATVDWQAVST